METKAVARTIGVTPRKVKLVLDLARGGNAGEAVTILKLANRASSLIIEKVLMSALANAKHNYGMNTDKLAVKEAYTNEGPTLKRFRPHAQGCASAINRRASHITIVVSDGKEEAKEA